MPAKKIITNDIFSAQILIPSPNKYDTLNINYEFGNDFKYFE